MKELMNFMRKEGFWTVGFGLTFGLTFYFCLATLVEKVVYPLVAYIVGSKDFASYVWTLGEGDKAVPIAWGQGVYWLLVFVVTLLFAFVLFWGLRFIGKKKK